ncbi:MAG: F0F1 ATP synthase subunit epsilon [Lactobacillaceae bacterium]|nr:F0F1 ATP synthase subunit epsilon [Lactobacillaceae bacterium]
MTKTNVFSVNIVTPDGNVFNNENVLLAVLNTQNGELGIMANRIPVIAALKIDRAKFQIQGQKDYETFAVNGGFAEFSDNILSIVAPSAENSKTIDVHRADVAKSRAEQRVNAAKTADERRRAEVALARAINRINTSKI